MNQLKPEKKKKQKEENTQTEREKKSTQTGNGPLHGTVEISSIYIKMNTSRERHLESNAFRMHRVIQLESRIRWSIFIITGVCAGLPALVWSVSDIINRRKNGHRISIFIILLLLTDFLEIFLSPYMLIKLLLNEFPCFGLDWTCRIFWALWSAMRDCGFLLNQLVALEGILSVKYPRYTASVFSSLCFQIVHMLVFICVIISEVLWGKVYLWVVLLIIVVSVIPLIISCGASCSHNHHAHTSRKSDPHILVIFILTLLVFYMQYTLIILLLFKVLLTYLSTRIFYITLYVMSLRLISDPLLCVLVCRQNLSLQTSQKPEGLV